MTQGSGHKSFGDGSQGYGFNGMQKDDELKGKGNSLDFKFRGYDPRLGKLTSVDPLRASFPWNSAYAFAENDVIRCKDLEGGEKLNMVTESSPSLGQPGRAQLTITLDYQVVTSGPGALHAPLNSTEFASRYSAGNVKLYMSRLPSADAPAILLSQKHERWAHKAEGAGKRAQRFHNKLVNHNVVYSSVEVTYHYTVSNGSTFDNVYRWLNEDRQGRGIIMTPGETGEFTTRTVTPDVYNATMDA